MAAKYQLITELYQRTGAAVSRNPQAWQSFLSSACRNYKCRFDEQLLIFAQRPDATAVTTLETWNRQFKRWVNKDSRGIAVFDTKGRRNTLKYYFDVSDTHEGYYNSRPVPIWQMNERYEQAVIERLSDRFGDLEGKEYSFVEAVQQLTGEVGHWIPPPPAPKKDEPKELLLPNRFKNCDRVIQYLFGRGIDYQLIQDCVADCTIFESAEYHNAVFVGKDESGTPKYAACRSTLGSTFKQDASGSDKRYSFRLLAKEPTDTVHLFEAAIDLLSYATYLKCEGKDYRKENLLSLSGVYQPKKEIQDSKVPIALTTFLKENPHIKTIILHLDNDKTGRLCTAALKELLKKDYEIVDDPPPVGKDFNDFLLSYLGMEQQKTSRERSDAR